MKIGVCGIACEVCPKMVRGKCPVGEAGCYPREGTPCTICSCAFKKGLKHCFSCGEFPCALHREGPLAFGFCQYIAGAE